MAVTALLDLHLKADRVDDGPAVLDAILKDTRAFEGNEGIEVLVDVTDPAHLMVVEHWASIERDEAYRAWRATPEGESGLGEILDRAPVLIKYEGGSTF